MSRGARPAAMAADAAELRGWQTDPDVIALRVEQVRSQVDRMCWAGVVLALAFTMTNVQQFAAGSAAVGSLSWLAAWVLDPTVSVVLVALLRAEQITARYQVPTGRWVRRAKWFTLAATYLMNTWGSYERGDLAAIVLHSIPPLVVFVAAEAITEVRDQLTRAATRAHQEAQRDRTVVNGTVHDHATAVHTDPHADAQPADAQPADRAEAAPAEANPDAPERVRTSFAEYLADARAAWSPGVEVTPAWVRQATGCSRGLSSRLARAVTAWATTPDATTTGTTAGTAGAGSTVDEGNRGLRGGDLQ
ncbi:hypothetical protein [Labedaea rhizosphaerae]|nr:hypothetical protein [Labedaea rhizosphaerae]